jgi:hypothetical protein
MEAAGLQSHIILQIKSYLKRKMQRRILVCGYTVYFANQDDHPKERYPLNAVIAIGLSSSC